IPSQFGEIKLKVGEIPSQFGEINPKFGEISIKTGGIKQISRNPNSNWRSLNNPQAFFLACSSLHCLN
ncbi:hypothetical protein BAVI_23088, partial [Neobacillus vireti LMG 21834]